MPEALDNYDTVLSPADEAKFQTWRKTLGENGNTADYDLRGFFKSGGQQAANGHFTDQFKKPNHTTFSDQSQYSTPDTPGGQWQDNGDQAWSFTPSAHILKLHGADALQKYFDTTEKGNKVILPPTGTAMDAMNSALDAFSKVN